MTSISSIRTEVSNYVDIKYFLKFSLLFTCLYYFNNFFVGITQPGGSYYPFIADHLNYVSVIRISVLHGANAMAHLLGMNTYLGSSFTLYNSDGGGVEMGWACAGLGVMSFWLSFILADNTSNKTKLSWSLGGLLTIWLINCIRVTLILVANSKNWATYSNMDHHDMFNKCSYILLALMIFCYYKRDNKQQVEQPA